VMDVLDWIPTELGEAVWTLAGWMSSFVCGLAGQTNMMKSVPPVPYAQAAALGALAVANLAQCNGPPIDCSQPAYSVCTGPNPLSTCPPQCIPAPPTTAVATTPWYLQWWVLAAAGIGLLLLLTAKKKPTEPEENLFGPKLPPMPVIPRRGPPPGIPLHPGVLKGARQRGRARRSART
jgi:hypothetical protein